MTVFPERRVRQPGPAGPARVVAVQAGALPIEAMLPAGVRLLDALAALVAGRGAESGCLHLSGGALGPFAYVIPALSPDRSQAAFYSDTRRPAGETRLEAGAVTVGVREGRPFFHCHALWTAADGSRGCGHVLPDETMVAAPIRVHGAGLVGARFEVGPDAETGFNLFTPRPTGTLAPSGATACVALRLAPNQDLVETLEQAAAAAGFARARVEGGVASTIGARFMDAPPIEGFATELLVRRGVVDGGAGDSGAGDSGAGGSGAGGDSAIDIAIVDLHGTIGEGRLVRGDNPVLMTFEGVLLRA